MFNNTRIALFEHLKTPCYFYDTDLLHRTLFAIKEAANLYNYKIHYAIKANANENILRIISSYEIGADCVSAYEIERSLNCGFKPSKIVFAGVGKTDDEIKYAINKDIYCINCESLEELNVINSLARILKKKVRVALRINPNINAETHENITTGLDTNKFGIPYKDLIVITDNIHNYSNLIIDGLHFHIGSQITNLNVFRNLCNKINEIQEYLNSKHITVNHINVGGGLGIDYKKPEGQIPDFQAYLEVFKKNLNTDENQSVHFEPGRSLVGQSAILLSKVLFVKENGSRKTMIIDAGFTELIRPALYQAEHKIINLSSNEAYETYDVAGPICETSDYFGRSIQMSKSKRGDLIAILSTGAYGEVMSSQYNLRTPALKYYSKDFELAENEILL